jgi:hypothetical protein
MEITSGILSNEQVRQEMAGLQDFLLRHNIREATVMFGWGCDEESTDIWKKFKVNSNAVVDFINERQEAVGFDLGSADLYVKCEQPTVVIQFCHESDVHVTTATDVIIEDVLVAWKRKGYSGNSRKDEKGAWESWGPSEARGA